MIPGAPEALQRLRKQGIPTLFVTNGGGVTEQAKAEALQAKLGVPVSPAQVLLCHTPVRELVTQCVLRAGRQTRAQVPAFVI